MKKIIVILTLATSMLTVSCGNETSHETSKVKTPETKNVETPKTKLEVVFDVPSLVGKNIDEIKKILGKPAKDDEPTKLQIKIGIVEWEKSFSKNGYDLLVTYNAKTRNVIDFFIGTNDPSGETKNYNDLLQVTNVSDNNSNVSVEPVKTLVNPDFYTGIKIRKK